MENKTVEELLRELLPEAKKIKTENKFAEQKIEVHFTYKRKKYVITLDEVDYGMKYGNKIELKYADELEAYNKEIIEATDPIKKKYKDMLESKDKEATETAQAFMKDTFQDFITKNI